MGKYKALLINLRMHIIFVKMSVDESEQVNFGECDNFDSNILSQTRVCLHWINSERWHSISPTLIVRKERNLIAVIDLDENNLHGRRLTYFKGTVSQDFLPSLFLVHLDPFK